MKITPVTPVAVTRSALWVLTALKMSTILTLSVVREWEVPFL